MAWLGDWAKRIKITIDNTNIDSDLTHFPIAIVIGAAVGQSNQDLSGIFDDLGSNYKKIAITKSDGTTQIYGEIEHWDQTNEKAVIWCASSGLTISSSSTTDLYIYFDPSISDNTSYIGIIGSTPSKNVWDSNFMAVYHMAQNPSIGGSCILDSTTNGNHGTPYGGMTSSDLVDGLIGKALDLDSTDYIALPDNTNFKPSYVSVEALCKTYSGNPLWARIFDRYYHTGSQGYALVINRTGRVVFHEWLTGGVYREAVGSTIVDGDGAWHYIVGSYEDNHTKIYEDGGLTMDTVGGSGTVIQHKSIQVPCIGDGVYDPQYTGLINEIRISNVARSSAWIKATNYTLRDDLLIFFSAETILIAMDDMAMDIQSWQEKTNNAHVDINAASWTIKEINLDCYAAFQVMSDTVVNIYALAERIKNQKVDIFAGSLGIDNVTLSIKFAEQLFKNAFLDVFLTDGIINQYVYIDIAASDGNKKENLGLDLMVVSTMPEFKYMYAMSLNSVIKEVA